VFYGRLLDNNGHRCESLTDLSYPVVLLQVGIPVKANANSGGKPNGIPERR
jgi:hypothetical protein